MFPITFYMYVPILELPSLCSENFLRDHKNVYKRELRFDKINFGYFG